MSEPEPTLLSTVLYAIRALHSGLIKFGVTTDPLSRLKGLRTANGDVLEFIVAVPGDRKDEQALHRRLASSRAQGEWYRETPEVKAILARMDEAAQQRQTWASFQPSAQPALLHRNGEPAVSMPCEERERMNEFRVLRETDEQAADLLDKIDALLAQPLDPEQIEKFCVAVLRRLVRSTCRLPEKAQQIALLRAMRKFIMDTLRPLDTHHRRAVRRSEDD